MSEGKKHQSSVLKLWNRLEADRNRVRVTAGRTMKGKSILFLLKQLEQTERVLFMIELILDKPQVSVFYKYFSRYRVEMDWRRFGVYVGPKASVYPGMFVACHSLVTDTKNWVSAELSERLGKAGPVLIRMYHTRKANYDKFGRRIIHDSNLYTSSTTSISRNPLSSQN